MMIPGLDQSRIPHTRLQAQRLSIPELFIRA
jgi:hypothetical protein